MTVNGMGRPRLVSYERLATLYLEALESSLPPITTIATILDITHKAADRRVNRARDHGYLPRGDPSTGAPTPDPDRGMMRSAGQQEAAQLAERAAIHTGRAKAQQARHDAHMARLEARRAATRRRRAQVAEERHQRRQQAPARVLVQPRLRITANPNQAATSVLDVFPGAYT